MFRHSALSQPARSRRCSAVRRDPGLTLNTPRDTCSTRSSDAKTVHRFKTQRLQKQQVERALDDIGVLSLP